MEPEITNWDRVMIISSKEIGQNEAESGPRSSLIDVAEWVKLSQENYRREGNENVKKE